MPIQPGLALQVKGLELPDPLAMQAQATQIQNALQQQRMGEMQMQNAMREQRRAQELESIMSGFEPTAPAADVAGRLRQRGFVAQAGQVLEQEAKRRQLEREDELAKFNLIKTKAELMGRMFVGVKDQQSYSLARQQAIQRGFGTEQTIPEAYDPAVVDRVLKGSMSVMDFVKNQLDERKTAATEATAKAAGVRAEAAASQAATAADKAAFERANPGFTIQETDQGLFKVNKRTGAMEPLMFEGAPVKAPERRPLTTINLDQRGEQAETVERGKGYVAHETEVRKAAAAARRSLTSIESAQDVLSKDFETGFGKETLAKGASVLAALGVDKAEKFATDAQKFLQAATERVLAAQLEQKGVQTNQDAQRIEQTGARMGNTKAANEFILDVARAQAERAIAQDKFYRDWLRDPANKKSLAGAEDAWLESEGGKSIFESPRLKKYNVLQAERAQTTPPPKGPVMGGRSATPRGSQNVGAGLSVQAPDGNTYTFPTQEQADQFRARISGGR